jgi:hypothetical protein
MEFQVTEAYSSLDWARVLYKTIILINSQKGKSDVTSQI